MSPGFRHVALQRAQAYSDASDREHAPFLKVALPFTQLRNKGKD
jgi:hypothetical protein